MLYRHHGKLEWDRISASAILRVRPHRTVPLGSKLLLLSHDSPGWAVLDSGQIELLKSLDGHDYSHLTDLLAHPQLRDALQRLYQMGLVEIDGRTGMTGSRETSPRPKDSRHPPPLPELVQIKPIKNQVQAFPSVPHTLLIKLTGACNWACTYCYDYSPSRFSKRLTLEDITEAVNEMASAHRSVTLMFHGGEPLLNFSEMRRICEFAEQTARRHESSVSFQIQTNGSLLDDEKVRFLREHRFGIGMSIDGPPQINDQTRVDHRGLGTSGSIQSLFDRYPEFMRLEVGYITTVTATNVKLLQTVAEYVRQLGIRSWKTAIFDPEGRGKEHPDLEVPVEPYIAFLEWALEQCSTNRWPGFRMKTLLELVEVIMTAERKNLCTKFPCGAAREFAVASADRSFLACDATYHQSFRLGSFESGLSSSQMSNSALALSERESWLLDEAECSSCPWLHFCAGTCMAKALLKHGTIKAVDDFECAVRKRIFPLLFEKLVEPYSGLLGYYFEDRQVRHLE